MDASRAALKRAHEAAKARRYDAAWEHLHEARQHEVAGYDDIQLLTTAHILRAEAEAKLGGWRQVAMLHLLTPVLDCTAPGKDERVRLSQAMKLRDEHYDNQYFKLRLVQKQVLLLLAVLLALLLLFALFARVPGALASGNAIVDQAKLVACILVGAIGACFSGLLSLASSAPKGTIPERVASTTITLARPAIGAASGVAAIVLLSAGLLPAATVLAIAFAFGFSERLAIGAIERVGSS